MTRRLKCVVNTLAIVVVGALWTGCGAAYMRVVKPSPKLSLLSPELANLSDAKIETYLQARAKPVFPTVVAVAKLVPAPPYACSSEAHARLEVIRGEEAAGWRSLADEGEAGLSQLVEQVQFLSPMLVDERATLKSLRDGAALLHAPVLLVYIQDDDARQGYNDAAMAYWTIVGLFCVPGHTVGHYSTCQGLLVDTRSGFILATIEGEAKREEHVLPGAVDIAADRVACEARAAAVAELQVDARRALPALAHEPR